MEVCLFHKPPKINKIKVICQFNMDTNKSLVYNAVCYKCCYNCVFFKKHQDKEQEGYCQLNAAMVNQNQTCDLFESLPL